MKTTLNRLLAGAVALVVLALFAVPAFTAEKMNTCAVSTSSAECVWANGNRQWLRVANSGGTNPAFCSTICPATATNGWPLTANQGTNIDTGSDAGSGGGPLRAGARYCCISTGGATTVIWQEVTAKGPTQSPTPVPTNSPAPTASP